MNGTTTREVQPALPPRSRVEEIAIGILLGIVAVSTFMVLVRLEDHLRGPSKVPVIRIVNPSDLLIDVDVSGRDRDGWLPISIVRPNDFTVTEDVVDQGDVWYFRFDVAGVPGGQVRVTSDELQQTNWTILIPERVIARLELGGAKPPVGSF